MWNITLPPAPAMSHLIIAGAVIGAIGLVLLLRGYVLGRFIVALAFAAAAAAAGPAVAPLLPIQNIYVVSGVMAVTAGLMAFVLARVAWGLLLGSVLAAVAVFVAIHVAREGLTAPAWTNHEPADFAAWLPAFGDYLAGWGRAFWLKSPNTMLLVSGAPVLWGLLLGLFWPRATAMISSSVTGGLLVLLATGLLVWAHQPAWAGEWVRRLYMPAIAAGVLAAFGLAVQVLSRRHAENRRKEAEQRDKAAMERAKKAPK